MDHASQEIEKTKTTELSKEKEFKPTSSMILWVDKTIELKTDDKKQIAEACNLSRQAWYKWLKLPGFEDWFYKAYEERTRRWRPMLDRIGLHHALKGNPRYWEGMQKIAGRLQNESTTEVNIDNRDQVINVHSALAQKYGK